MRLRLISPTIVLMFAIVSCGPSPAQLRDRAHQAAEEKRAAADAALIDKAKSELTEKLVDPAATQFRRVSVRGENVCGEFNAKNRMGGYNGFIPFEMSVKYANVSSFPEHSEAETSACQDEVLNFIRTKGRSGQTAFCQAFESFTAFNWKRFHRDCAA